MVSRLRHPEERAEQGQCLRLHERHARPRRRRRAFAVDMGYNGTVTGLNVDPATAEAHRLHARGREGRLKDLDYAFLAKNDSAMKEWWGQGLQGRRTSPGLAGSAPVHLGRAKRMPDRAWQPLQARASARLLAVSTASASAARGRSSPAPLVVPATIFVADHADRPAGDPVPLLAEQVRARPVHGRRAGDRELRRSSSPTPITQRVPARTVRVAMRSALSSQSLSSASRSPTVLARTQSRFKNLMVIAVVLPLVGNAVRALPAG